MAGYRTDPNGNGIVKSRIAMEKHCEDTNGKVKEWLGTDLIGRAMELYRSDRKSDGGAKSRSERNCYGSAVMGSEWRWKSIEKNCCAMR